ncbi:TrmH family RNA methyltransferase [Sporolituus thermophilus]|uniref:RNA methyltransferase, TrmH family n=1 Tax=Sporolituus thermophilus DSM 23256 TaxID=1123285 RepID=A0A1G7JFN3_9FIRM|nr:RNA methyltransferase [Sporolituus thermophilus]SDF23703.1 RNA methyltransferase, TrmH family [Sporolituus thermophilus DSM 23256]
MTDVITSPNNQIIKKVASLKQKKYRDEYNLFAVEGIRLVEEAAGSAWRPAICFYTEKAAAAKRVQSTLEILAAKGCRIVEVSDNVYTKITDTDQPQGILCVMEKKQYTFSDLQASDRALIVILDNVQDPGNIGTVVRTADAAGCCGVILTKGCADLFSGKTVRATMGSLFHLPVITGVTEQEVAAFLEQRNIRLLATALDASSLYHDVDLRGPVAIVFGNEGAGVSKAILEKADERVYIPLYGRAESLNVAVAAAVILYEARRQRRMAYL